MAFDAGAVVGEAILDDSKWQKGAKGVGSSSKSLAGVLVKGLAVGFAAVSAAMAASIAKANAYQKEFANVSTLTSQNTAALQQMSLGLLSLDSELGTTTELTKSMYDAISAGAKPGADALQTVAASAKFAKASLADNAASVKLLSAATNAYGRENLSADKAADVFFTTIKQGVVTGEELSGTIGQSIPLFSSMNIPIEQLASGMAAMTKQGVSASESTTQLNAIVSSFLKPSEALSEHLASVGYESGEAFIKAEGLTGALDLLASATESGDAEIAELMPNIRGMRGVMALSGQGAIEYANTLDAMAESSGAVDVAFQKQEKTFATFKAEAEKSMVVVGNIGKFFVDEIAVGAQEALESINQFIISGRAMEPLSKIVERVGAAFNVVKVFGQELYNMFKDSLGEVVTDIKQSFSELFSTTEGGSSSFDLMADAINALGAGLSIIVKMAKIYIDNIINMLKINKSAIMVFKTLYDVIRGKATFEDVKKSLAEVGDSYKEFGIDFKDNVVDVVKEGQKQWKRLAGDQKPNAKTFSDAWKKGGEDAKSSFQKNYNAMVSGVTGANEVVQESSEETAEVVQTNEQDTTGVVKKEVEKRKSFYNGWTDFVKENLTNSLETFKFWADQVFQLTDTMFSGLQEISGLHYQNERDKITLETQERLVSLEDGAAAEQEALVAKLDQGIITDEEFNIQSEALERSTAAEKEKINKEALAKNNEIAKKEFDSKKKWNIAQTWMDAAKAVMSYVAWGAPLGPPGWATAAVMSGATIGLAGKKTAEINRQQFVPAFKDGTNSAPGGMALVGEEGEELVNLPRGSQVIPNDITKDILSSTPTQEKNTIISFNNPVVREEQDIDKIASAVSEIQARELQFA